MPVQKVSLNKIVTTAIDSLSFREEAFDQYDRYYRMAKHAVQKIGSYAALSETVYEFTIRQFKAKLPLDIEIIDYVEVAGAPAYYTGQANILVGSGVINPERPGVLLFDLQDDCLVFPYSKDSKLEGKKGSMQIRFWESDEDDNIFVPAIYQEAIENYFSFQRAKWVYEINEGRSGRGLYNDFKKEWEDSVGRIQAEIEQPTGEMLEYIGRRWASKVAPVNSPLKGNLSTANDSNVNNDFLSTTSKKPQVQIYFWDGTFKMYDQDDTKLAQIPTGYIDGERIKRIVNPLQ